MNDKNETPDQEMSKDAKFEYLTSEVRSIRGNLCMNQSQDALRTMAYTLKIALAETEMYLDARNEQGRGGLKQDK
jgi:hypothetical protein